MYFPNTKTMMFFLLLLCLSIQRGYARNTASPTKSSGKDLLRGSRYRRNASMECIEAERQALLSFKEDLNLSREYLAADPLSSWGNGDCCNWYGVRCAGDSGHVVSLFIDHSLYILKGKLSLSLFELRHLNYLSLTSMNFGGRSQIPSSIGMLSELKELRLINNGLIGELPKELGNLSRLESLDLGSNDLHGSIPQTLSNLTSLKQLHLQKNRLSGSIPDIFGNMSELAVLSLYNNMLEGEFPRSIWSLSSLTSLRVQSNKLHGHLSKSMSQLKLLGAFDISKNFLNGRIREGHFTNLSVLKFLDLSSNSFRVRFRPNWTPPFKLEAILLGSCKLGPRFPEWLRTQTNFSFLNISDSGISDSIPSWFWFLSSNVHLIDLSHNQIHGGIQNYNLSLHVAVTIDLSSNQLEGSVPSFLTQFYTVNLYRNRFSKLNFSCNIYDDSPLEFLDISSNELRGELVDCWSPFKFLEVLVLSNNSLSGGVPFSLGFLSSVLSLNLNMNNLSGELPLSLQNCRDLAVLDISNNKLSGAIPFWIGKFTSLIILSLRFNNFSGEIPNSLCLLSSLTVLDMSCNNITGIIPNCIIGFDAMRVEKRDVFILSLDYTQHSHAIYEEKLQVVWKGGVAEFKTTLGLVVSIDLSGNKLSGEIPREITKLFGLVSLNLSRNNLSGEIPMDIGFLESLDALDLSWNKLNGRIPQSLARIDRLNALDLSNNYLSGKIPTGTQLQSFMSAYWGNFELCGDPLLSKCSDATVPFRGAANEDFGELFSRGFLISTVIGFTTAFWGVCVVLIFNKFFRNAYFKLLSDVGDRIFVPKR